MSLLSLVKKNLRARLVIAWLVVVIVVYVVLNGYLLKHMGSVGDLASVRGANSELAELKDRIKRLESSIDSSINSVKQLNESISQALKSLNNKSPVAPPARQTVNTDETRIAVLVIACHRPTAIKNHLDQLIEKRGKSSRMIAKFPIIVSQDCNHAETAQVIESFGDSLHAFVKQPDQSDIAQDGNKPVAVHMRGYYKISRHYKFALDQAFLKFNFSSVIITEDDLNVAADFFDYFATMHKVLVADSTLYCVSAWNDNGKKDTIDSSARDLVHRSDFFPGLGWMLQRSLWTNELAAKWPSAFWDDWLRLNEQRKNRACLRPEISRTEMSIQSAKQGVSKLVVFFLSTSSINYFSISSGQFLDKFLSKINMNNEPVDWSSKNVDNLIKV